MGIGKAMRLIATLSVLVAIGLFAYVVKASNMISYLSSDPKVCINCHTMNTVYATWQHSSHRNRATCVECHLPRDSFAHKMLAKSRDGFKHSVAMTFRTYGLNIRATENAADRIQANCIMCHQEMVSQIAINSALYPAAGSKIVIDRRCWDCHREVPHGINTNLTATPDNLGVKEL
jgi:cytochrome c nitrite reductase small subunit